MGFRIPHSDLGYPEESRSVCESAETLPEPEGELNGTSGSAVRWHRACCCSSLIQLLGEKSAPLNGLELKRLKEKEALTNVILKCKLLIFFSLMVRITEF